MRYTRSALEVSHDHMCEFRQENEGVNGKLVDSGDYKDDSELISLAIGNQFLLHNAGANALVPSQEIRQINGVAASSAAPPAKPTGDRSGSPAPNQRELASLPEVFRLATELKRPDSLAPLPNDAFVAGMGVPVDRWIFGQHNKLLPVKASVRALANLLQNEPNPAGVLLTERQSKSLPRRCRSVKS